MSSVRGVHVPSAIGAVDEAKWPAKGKSATMKAKEPAKGKDDGKGAKKPFPGAAKPFTKGGKKGGKK